MIFDAEDLALFERPVLLRDVAKSTERSAAYWTYRISLADHAGLVFSPRDVPWWTLTDVGRRALRDARAKV